MGKKEEYESKTAALVMPVIGENGLELVDVEYVKEGGNRYLRVYIDKENGVTINDCEHVSRRLGDMLDEEDYIEDSYILEVSSPGLTRPLKKDGDFERNTGKDVEVRLYTAIDGSKNFEGVLVSYDRDTVSIKTDENTRVFKRADIALIRLALNF